MDEPLLVKFLKASLPRKFVSISRSHRAPVGTITSPLFQPCCAAQARCGFLLLFLLSILLVVDDLI